ncbi:MAG: hypothetical protein HYY67_05085 [Thaumarchaeota archaeon]|nr:hypothetical protein [Nitrososphaerota archaeon]
MVRTILLLTLLFISIGIPQVLADDYTPHRLVFTLYDDGKTVVEYEVLADASHATIKIPLLGSLYETILVINERGLPLDYHVEKDGVLIDSLGSSQLRITYSTSDLTSKIGRIWTIKMDSPIDFRVILPADSTIVGLTSPPITISVADGRQILTLPKGVQEVSYMIGPVGSKEEAMLRISEVEEGIAEAKAKGVNVADAEAILQRARQEFEAARYFQAEMLAREAKRLVDEPGRLSPNISDNPLLIGIAQPPVATLLLGLLFALTIGFALRRRKKGVVIEVSKTFRQIDIQKILEGRDHLRPDDREALEFIGQAGGEVFESELREKFKLPRSTAWRMIKRLEREGLLEVRKVGGQNLVMIRDDISADKPPT